MEPRTELAALSRDSHLALRRVERQQVIIERLHHAHGCPLSIGHLAVQVGASERTVARDVERLRLSGVPLQVKPGRGGGVRLAPVSRPTAVQLDLPEIAALMSSLTVLGPSVSDSAESAMQKLARAIAPATASHPHAGQPTEE